MTFKLSVVRVQLTLYSLVSGALWVGGGDWKLTGTGLVAGSPGEAICVDVHVARVMDDMMCYSYAYRPVFLLNCNFVRQH